MLCHLPNGNAPKTQLEAEQSAVLAELTAENNQHDTAMSMEHSDTNVTVRDDLDELQWNIQMLKYVQREMDETVAGTGEKYSTPTSRSKNCLYIEAVNPSQQTRNRQHLHEELSEHLQMLKNSSIIGPLMTLLMWNTER